MHVCALGLCVKARLWGPTLAAPHNQTILCVFCFVQKQLFFLCVSFVFLCFSFVFLWFFMFSSFVGCRRLILTQLWGRRGENSQTCTFEGPGLQKNTSKFHEKTPQGREDCGGKGEQMSELGRNPPFGPTLRGIGLKKEAPPKGMGESGVCYLGQMPLRPDLSTKTLCVTSANFSKADFWGVRGVGGASLKPILFRPTFI